MLSRPQLHGRCGTLWEDRFKSVLVEGSGLALATMAEKWFTDTTDGGPQGPCSHSVEMKFNPKKGDYDVSTN